MITIKPRPIQFSAAHHLPRMPEGHRCRRMHGHTYRVTVEIGGELVDGMLADYEDVAQIVRGVASELDHRVLNEIEGLDNPTTEILAVWLAKRIGPAIDRLGFHLFNVEVDEGGHVARWISA